MDPSDPPSEPRRGGVDPKLLEILHSARHATGPLELRPLPPATSLIKPQGPALAYRSASRHPDHAGEQGARAEGRAVQQPPGRSRASPSPGARPPAAYEGRQAAPWPAELRRSSRTEGHRIEIDFTARQERRRPAGRVPARREPSSRGAGPRQSTATRRRSSGRRPEREDPPPSKPVGHYAIRNSSSTTSTTPASTDWSYLRELADTYAERTTGPPTEAAPAVPRPRPPDSSRKLP